MERRVPPVEREILPGVVLTVSTMGNYSVIREGTYLGFIHASVAPLWNTYVRRVGQDAQYLGKMEQDEAVIAIVKAWDEGVTTLNRRSA